MSTSVQKTVEGVSGNVIGDAINFMSTKGLRNFESYRYKSLQSRVISYR